MRNSSATLVLLVLVLGASSCSRAPKRDFPLVQKYTTQAGDLFYFRPRDGQFVLLERRKALAVAVAPEPNIQAYAYDNRITVSRPQGDMLENRTFVEKIGAQQTLAMTADGRTLAGGDANGVVTVWEIATGNLALHLDVPGPILSLAFSGDGNWLAIGLAKPAGEPADTVWLYEIHSNGPHRSFGRTAVPALAWSADGARLAAHRGSDGDDARVSIYRRPAGASAALALADRPDAFRAPAFSSRSGGLILGLRRDGDAEGVGPQRDAVAPMDQVQVVQAGRPERFDLSDRDRIRAVAADDQDHGAAGARGVRIRERGVRVRPDGIGRLPDGLGA